MMSSAFQIIFTAQLNAAKIVNDQVEIGRINCATCVNITCTIRRAFVQATVVITPGALFSLMQSG